MMTTAKLTARMMLTNDEAAAHLGIQPQTLALWRCNGRYAIPYVRVGRSIRYRLADLDAWLDSRTIGGGDADAEDCDRA